MSTLANRYAIRSSADKEAGIVWSTGGCWSSAVPAADALMAGPDADAFAAHHPAAEIVDVIVYREACAVWNKAFNAEIAALGDRRSTHEERQAARAVAHAAVKAAGYTIR